MSSVFSNRPTPFLLTLISVILSTAVYYFQALTHIKMNDLFSRTSRPAPYLFGTGQDKNDPRLGDVVWRNPDQYASADVVILGCPQDEGVRRYGDREGSALAPVAIREQFYKLTPFNIRKKVFDLGDLIISGTLEETHENQRAVVKQILNDGKRLIVIGGGNDISYPDGVAMAEVFGAQSWIAINVDSHLGVRIADQRNSGTPYRQLLEEKHLDPRRFFQVGYQTHFCSPVYYEYIRSLGVQRISLEMLRSRAECDMELKEMIKQKFVHHSSEMNVFFGFDISVVRSADAPGSSSPSPLGLRAGEFIQLVKYAASLANTRMVEFSEVNPKFDEDGRTAKLVAIAMHRFCSGVS